RTRALRRSSTVLIFAMGYRPLLLLAFLAEGVFAGVSHALALVRLRTAIAPDLRSHLADLLLVDARHHDLGRLRRLDVDAIGYRIDHIVTEAQIELQFLALGLGAVADAADLQGLGEALVDPVDQVGDERARHAPHRARALAHVARGHGDAIVVQLGDDFIDQHRGELALGTLDLDLLAVQRGGDATGDGNGLLTYTRH